MSREGWRRMGIPLLLASGLIPFCLVLSHISKRMALESKESLVDEMLLEAVKQKLDSAASSSPTTERAVRIITRFRNNKSWNSTDQAAYDAAVNRARSVERNSKQVYQPLRMSQGYVHEAELEQESFEEQLVDMVKQLEPTYLAESLDWAESGDQRVNAVLRPIVYALEKPIVKDLDLEAKIRVEHAVEALAKSHDLSLVDKERLRAHLMAPLLVRIRARVHSQVSQYVVKLARNVVLKASNSSNPVVQDIVAQLHGNGAHNLGLSPSVPHLREEDSGMVKAVHDLNALRDSGVLNEHDYETQKAKLLSDWLKHAVNEAGGNSNEVLRIVLGGDVHGVTDTGIKNPSPIDVDKKIAMEKGISTRMQERSTRLNSDLVYQLIHSKAQWGSIVGCDGQFNKPSCATKWREIRDLVRSYARQDDLIDDKKHSAAAAPSSLASTAESAASMVSNEVAAAASASAAALRGPMRAVATVLHLRGRGKGTVSHPHPAAAPAAKPHETLPAAVRGHRAVGMSVAVKPTAKPAASGSLWSWA